MLKRLTIITGTILLASAAWAEVLDKASSLGVAQDATTGIWTLECLSEVTGISRSDAHSVGASVQIADGTGAITIFSIQKDMLPAERRVTESAEGVYDFEMKKAGNRIKVSIDVLWPSVGTGDRFICVINIAKGLTGAHEQLYAMEYTHSIRSSGTP